MSLKDELKSTEDKIKALMNLSEGQVKGARVRIIKKFRDQPWGTSKPDLQGKIYTVDFLHFSNNRIIVFVEGLRCSLALDQIEFLTPKL